MQGRIVKKGFYVVGRTTKVYRPCTLVAGPYDFQNAVRLKIGDQELICHADQFVETKPPSLWKLELVARKNKVIHDRADLVLRVCVILEKHGREMSLKDLSGAADIWPAVTLWQRLAHWQEFKPVHWTKDGKFKFP